MQAYVWICVDMHMCSKDINFKETASANQSRIAALVAELKTGLHAVRICLLRTLDLSDLKRHFYFLLLMGPLSLTAGCNSIEVAVEICESGRI